MARVFLVNPPSLEPVRTPLLSFAYLAAALERGGHEVALLDAAAPHAPHGTDQIRSCLAAFAPDLVGIHLKTQQVQPGYALARALAPDFRLVAGGPHATVAPIEALEEGFPLVVRGEGEEALVELADAVDSGGALAAILGLAFVDGNGRTVLTPGRGFLADLDGLASPVPALRHFDPRWYGSAQPVPFAGILASRGCPAACTFCANNVTGRRFRYRSAELIAAEIGELRRSWGLGAFSFFDDSFAVGRRRLLELAAALAAIRSPPWSCTAHPSHLDPDILEAMKRGGCGGLDIGMESGDPERLLTIGKGVTVSRVLDVLRWCRTTGLHVVVNLMFGWPGETEAELDHTAAFMEQACELGAMFNARGVAVPYPGTELYDDHHRRFGFTEWWRREPSLDYRPFPASWSRAEIERAYADDPALERNFFALPPNVTARIASLLERKARLTYDRLALPFDAPGSPAAAGAR